MGGQLDGGFGGWVDGWYRGAIGRDIMDSIHKIHDYKQKKRNRKIQ